MRNRLEIMKESSFAYHQFVSSFGEKKTETALAAFVLAYEVGHQGALQRYYEIMKEEFKDDIPTFGEVRHIAIELQMIPI